MAKRMAKQMELFEPVERGFDEGGLMDEGGTVDPVSGNDVPPGSTQEEVRDDIPAQLSEGEFVIPADVVRYIGLENLMRMRQEAKQGLAQMEAMGQMGNGDEAVMPDDLPFDEYDLEVEDDELQMNVGGYVPPSVPQQPYNQPTQVNPQTGTYTLPGTGIAGYQVPSGAPTGYTPYGGAQPYFQPVQFTGPQFQTALQTTNLPTFAETVGQRPGQYDELRMYQNDAGQTLQIPFKDGKPIYPIPEGYKPMGEQPKQEEAPTTVTPTLGQTQVRDDRGGEKEDAPSTPFGGNVNTLESEAYTNAVKNLAKNQLLSISPVLNVGQQIAKKIGMDVPSVTRNELATASNLARQETVTALGYNDISEVSANDLDKVGLAMEIAQTAVNDIVNAGSVIRSTTGPSIVGTFDRDLTPEDMERITKDAAEFATRDPEEAANKIAEARQRQAALQNKAEQLAKAMDIGDKKREEAARVALEQEQARQRAEAEKEAAFKDTKARAEARERGGDGGGGGPASKSGGYSGGKGGSGPGASPSGSKEGGPGSFAEGGLVKQMKQSGIASKK